MEKSEGTTFGLQAEEWLIDMLRGAGYEVKKSTWVEDREYKVDFWIKRSSDGKWLAIQFSVDLEATVSWKGKDALRRGIVPSWLNGNDLKKAAAGDQEINKKLLAQFWHQTDNILKAHPECSLRRPAVSALASFSPAYAASV